VVQRGEGLRLYLPDEGGEDLFVHYSDIVGDGFRSLEEGAKVSYEPQRGKKGMQAQDVFKV
jgi:cold shock protein